ncbi:hypothetical protein ACFL4T_14405 [candidate division KSB1 bacterium]
MTNDQIQMTNDKCQIRNNKKYRGTMESQRIEDIDEVREKEQLKKAVKEKQYKIMIKGEMVAGVVKYFRIKKYGSVILTIIGFMPFLAGAAYFLLGKEFDLPFSSFGSLFGFYWIANIVIIKIVQSLLMVKILRTYELVESNIKDTDEFNITGEDFALLRQKTESKLKTKKFSWK